eukprot:CAMPEP_0197902492 /NCGR_PEP_ID=MMETSP1439-20131203/53597_1 /TAXON_ID=66791 /ORGANISM="Gonyaulax spinifera, Strain CCMP409" /LENGTH=85 /DNA_ID=CAMNT_0043523521 /DNA_START=268 /DNA_END=526 /DNA_ORIENTATION=+
MASQAGSSAEEASTFLSTSSPQTVSVKPLRSSSAFLSSPSLEPQGVTEALRMPPSATSAHWKKLARGPVNDDGTGFGALQYLLGQ